MVTLMQRRRQMMQMAASPEPGIEYTNLESVKFQNAKGSTLSVGTVGYSSTITFYPNAGTNISSGSTSTRNNVLTDGEHIWFMASSVTSIKYNGENATFSKSGNYFRISLPENFDANIPFVLS